MKIIQIVFFVFFYSSLLKAQIWEEDLAPCGSVVPLHANETPTEKHSSNADFDVLKTIPVVFHVLHEGGFGNPSKEDLLGIIDLLNQDYNAQNPDLQLSPTVFKNQAVNMDVVFRLATKDPDGNCTDGINRIYTPLTRLAPFTQDPPVHWPTNMYLNIYVCQSLFNATANEIPSGLSGFGWFPGNYDPYDGIYLADFTVKVSLLNNLAIKQGITNISHETGHWLDLKHIWGDDDDACTGTDGVSDTPNQAGPSRKCNDDFPFVTCNNGPNGNMFCNFMDYGTCVTMFTEGQKNRAQAALVNYSQRNNVWQSSNLMATGVLDPVCTNMPPKADFAFTDHRFLIKCEPDLSVHFEERCYRGAPTTVNWSFPGGTPATSTEFDQVVAYPGPGEYPVTLIAVNNFGVDTLTRIITLQTIPGSSYAPGSDGENFENADSIQETGAVYHTLNDFNFSICLTSGYNSARSLYFPKTANHFDARFITRKFTTTATDTILSFKVASRGGFEATLGIAGGVDCFPLLGNPYNKNIGVLSNVDLTSANFNGLYFFPSGLDDWNIINLTIPEILRNRDDVQFLFAYRSSSTNNFFIDDIKVTSSPITSIAEPSITSAFNIFPNPIVDGSFSYEIKKESFRGNLSLYDLYGKLVIQQEVSNISGTIDTKGIQPGIYFCQIVSKKEQVAFLPKKVIIF